MPGQFSFIRIRLCRGIGVTYYSAPDTQRSMLQLPPTPATPSHHFTGAVSPRATRVFPTGRPIMPNQLPALDSPPRGHAVSQWRPSSLRNVVGTMVVLLSACGGDAPTATAPSSSLGVRLPGSAAAVSEAGGDSLSRWLSNTPGTCLVGTRTLDGRYPSRVVTMPWPARLASISSRTARLAYRGWQAGLPEPALLAVCTIADVPGAREFLSGRLGGKAMDAKALRAFAKSAGATKTEEWGLGVSPHVMQGAAPVFMIDGLASRFPTIRGARQSVVPLLGAGGDAGVMMICDDPTAPGCSGPVDPPPPPPPPPTCDPYVDLPQPGCEETVPTIPPESTMPSVSPIPASATNQCWGQTQYAHLSGTLGYEHRVNVHATTECDALTSLSVTVTLHRQRCFLWVFCGWPQIGNVGDDRSSFDDVVDANASEECVWADGWFKGHGYHTATLPEGPGSAETNGPPQYIDCFPLQQ